MTFEKAKQLRELKKKEVYVMQWVDNKKIFVETKDKNHMLTWAHAIKDGEYTVSIMTKHA